MTQNGLKGILNTTLYKVTIWHMRPPPGTFFFEGVPKSTSECHGGNRNQSQLYKSKRLSFRLPCSECSPMTRVEEPWSAVQFVKQQMIWYPIKWWSCWRSRGHCAQGSWGLRGNLLNVYISPICMRIWKSSGPFFIFFAITVSPTPTAGVKKSCSWGPGLQDLIENKTKYFRLWLNDKVS